jgi:hypothetical protein
MKIVAIKIQPIARIVALIYGGFGVLFWISYCLMKSSPFMVLPIGIVVPWLHLNFNFFVERSNGLLHYILLLPASIICYGVSGWFSAAVAVLCFNLIAKLKHGIDADFISFAKDREAQNAQGNAKAQPLMR